MTDLRTRAKQALSGARFEDHEAREKMIAQVVAFAKAEIEACAVMVERAAFAADRPECCGCGIGGFYSPAECCAEPYYMIADRVAAAAIRARSEA